MFLRRDEKVREKVFIFFFTFEELNSMALLNATFFLRRERERERFVAYVPPGFSRLAFAADEIRFYPPHLLRYTHYSEVNEFSTSNSSRFSRHLRRLTEKLRSVWLWIIFRLKIRNGLLFRVLKLFPTPRARKYFFMSGLYKWAISDAREKYGTAASLVFVHDYVEFSASDQIALGRPELGNSFVKRFQSLYKAIAAGLVLRVQPPNEKRVTLRTRNYIDKATVHNSTVAVCAPLAQNLVGLGLKLENMGSPPLRLGLINRNYSEWDFLSLDEEIARWGFMIFTEGGAGLFTLVACSDLPICLLSPEWSVENYLSEPTSLLEARQKRAGVNVSDFRIFDPSSEKKIMFWLTDNMEKWDSKPSPAPSTQNKRSMQEES